MRRAGSTGATGATGSTGATGARATRPRALAIGAALLVTALGAGLLPGAARASISASQVVAGPANDILDVDGAALAPGGTGGVVYRAEVDGVVHVFASRLDHGTWGAPVEVDPDDLYGASQPAIGAGDGGQLLVVWVQPRAVNASGVTLYELMSAYMGPGASTFGPAIMIDPNVAENDTGDYGHVDPHLVMAPDGDAYVVYRVVDDDCSPTQDASNPTYDECPTTTSRAATPTAAIVEIRVARFQQGPWSSMGEINRAPQLAMRVPSADNEPAIGIGDGKAGVVVWQEPDATGVARIWARRLFGTTVGNVIELSPTTIDGQEVGADADSPAAGFDDTGLATASFRLEGGAGNPLGAGEVMSQVVPATEAEITPAANVAGGATISPPSLAEDADGDERIAYVAAGEAYATNGSAASPVALGPATGEAWTSVDPGGGGVTAWPGSENGLPVIDVSDEFPGGGSQFGELVGGVSGPLTGLSFGEDPEGDAVAAWMQGAPGASEVVAGVADVAPQSFTVQTPTGWQSDRPVRVSWNPAAASTAVTYSVLVNGQTVLSGLQGPSATAPSSNPRFPSRPVSPTGEAATISRLVPLGGSGSGAIKDIQIVATDANGQTVTSSVHTVEIDTTPPLVTLAHIDDGRGVRVTVTDDESGVDAAATRIEFGAGTRSRSHAVATHVYPAPGTDTITAHVRDQAGNAATIHLSVRVR